MPVGEAPANMRRLSARSNAIDPQDQSRMCAALEINGSMSSADGGRTWADCSGDLVRLADDEKRKSRILTESDAEGMLDAHAVCISPAGPRAAFLANRIGIFRSLDNGRTWEDLEVGRYSAFTYGRDIRASVGEPGVLYAALSASSQGNVGSVVRSADQGETWSRFDHDVAPQSTVMSIGQHPVRSEIVFFAARRGQVFGTVDAGKTWQTFPLPAGCEGVYSIACA